MIALVHRFHVAAMIALAVSGVAHAGAAQAPATQPLVASAYQSLMSDARVKAALKQIEKQDARTFQEQIRISEIPAPPFKEAVRAADYLRRLQELGLTDAAIDADGNVVARRKGAGQGPTMVLSAHLDTVFPEGTDVTVREKEGLFHGPGLADDARGLAVLLTVLRAMQDNNIRTSGDVLFVGTVGEEGLGNLRGVKALFREHKNIDAFISVDSVDSPTAPGARNSIISQATGSRRWSITFKGPGGHSFEDFGSPSAVHAMGRAIASISDMQPPADPKTTFTVGVVSGGTSINAIAAEAQMQIDIRSNSAESLAKLEREILAAADAAVAAENARWGSKEMRLESKLLGDRPAGIAQNDSPVALAALGAAAALKLPRPALVAASTDSNVPLALGIPAATVSGGGEGGKTHSLDEWYKPVNAWIGPQSVLLTTLALVGVEGVSHPVLRPALPAQGEGR